MKVLITLIRKIHRQLIGEKKNQCVNVEFLCVSDHLRFLLVQARPHSYSNSAIQEPLAVDEPVRNPDDDIWQDYPLYEEEDPNYGGGILF